MKAVVVSQLLLAFASAWNIIYSDAQGLYTKSVHQRDRTSLAVAQERQKILRSSTIEQIAKEITVEVILSSGKSGSGIIVALYKSKYTVITNEHVIAAGTIVEIVTSDGKTHVADKIGSSNPEGLDLAILQFTSDDQYSIADYKLSQYDSIAGDIVYASGYPIEGDPSQSPGFTFISGQIEMLTDSLIQGGYQIGSTLEVAKGMSGGPLLNSQGEVVGINGMHQYPLWGNPYIFTDGTTPNEESRMQMEKYSWSIPSPLIFQFLISTAESQ